MDLQKVIKAVTPAEAPMNAGSTTGVQKSLFFLDSGFRRNDTEARFLTFYEHINDRFTEADPLEEMDEIQFGEIFNPAAVPKSGRINQKPDSNVAESDASVQNTLITVEQCLVHRDFRRNDRETVRLRIGR